MDYIKKENEKEIYQKPYANWVYELKELEEKRQNKVEKIYTDVPNSC